MKVKLYMEGDKGRAICQKCSCIVETTFKRRDVPFSDGIGLAKDILVATCDNCDAIAAIPSQSTPAIRVARKAADHSIEAKLPAIYVDALDLACFQLSQDASTEFRKRLVTFYIHKYASGALVTDELSSALNRAEKIFPVKRGSGVASRRISFKVSPPIANEMENLIESTHLSKTNLLKSIVFKIKEDVIDKDSKKILPELKSLVFGF